MPAIRLTGSRIRERRLASAIKQGDLARMVGISPAYLNLIEHNRRRIGGKLIVDLARALEVEPTQLTEGAEDALVAALRDAAARAAAPAADAAPDAPVELDRTEDFAGRFPGWAALTAAQAGRIEALERLVESLSDRLTHDPQLAAALHEVLSAVTAVRASASILTETRDIDPDWQARFLRNVGEDSARLSESAEGLVAYLDAGAEARAEGGPLSPVDALADFVAAAGYFWPDLEDGAGRIGPLIAAAPGLAEGAAAEMARAVLRRYRADAALMPEAAFVATRKAVAGDPARIAARFGTGIDSVLRRFAALAGEGAGLVVCDGSGTLTLAKPIDGFALPRFGAACPFWPLYQALARPAQPVSALLEMPGRTPRRFRARAVALPLPGTGFDAPPVQHSTMLIEPADDDPGPATLAGSSCRICPRDACPARREPSILGFEPG